MYVVPKLHSQIGDLSNPKEINTLHLRLEFFRYNCCFVSFRERKFHVFSKKILSWKIILLCDTSMNWELLLQIYKISSVFDLCGILATIFYAIFKTDLHVIIEM